jgi:ankyrin repeat protein
LTLAARGKKRETVKLLLDRGADASVRLPTRASTALHQAVAAGDVEIVKLLVNAGAEIDALNSNGETPLNYAAHHGAKDVVEFLASRGADLNSRSRTGLTPLLEAEGGGYKEAADLLRRLGARE